MMIASSLLVILTNLLVLGLLWLVWRYFRGRGPMTAAKLRRTVAWERIEPENVIPCGGDVGAMAALLRALEQGGFRSAVMEAVIAAYEKNKEFIK